MEWPRGGAVCSAAESKSTNWHRNGSTGTDHVPSMCRCRPNARSAAHPFRLPELGAMRGNCRVARPVPAAESSLYRVAGHRDLSWPFLPPGAVPVLATRLAVGAGGTSGGGDSGGDKRASAAVCDGDQTASAAGGGGGGDGFLETGELLAFCPPLFDWHSSAAACALRLLTCSEHLVPPPRPLLASL